MAYYLKKRRRRGCGPIAGKSLAELHITPSLLGLRRYPIGPLTVRAPHWLGATGSHHTM